MKRPIAVGQRRTFVVILEPEGEGSFIVPVRVPSLPEIVTYGKDERSVPMIRTMYRVLAEHDKVRDGRRQLRRPVYQKPELLAEGPNQVWSWDITKLMGPVTIDIFSRRFVACCIEDAKTFCRSFFDWYNQDHHHAGIGLMTPDEVHYGQAGEVYAARQKTLDRGLQSNPERVVKKSPEPPLKPTAAWINPPTQKLRIRA